MNVRRKIYKKRAAASMFWTLGGDVQMAVKLFNLVTKALPSKHISVDLRTSQPLRISAAYICNDTGKPFKSLYASTETFQSLLVLQSGFT